MLAQFAATLNGWLEMDRHKPHFLRRLESFNTVFSDAMMAGCPIPSTALRAGSCVLCKCGNLEPIHFGPSLSLSIRPYFLLLNSRLNALFLSNLVECK